MKSENNDQQLIDKLKQLPKIEDQRDKKELFQSISSQMNIKKVQKQKRYQLIPIFSILLVTVIIIAIVPLMNNLSMSESSQYDSADESISIEEANESDHELSTGNTDKSADHHTWSIDNDIESYVIQNIDDHSTIIYGAVVDDQLQSVIPITIIIPEIIDLNIPYNQLEQYLNEADWGVNEYLFKDALFELNLPRQEVVMKISDTFSLRSDSVNANIFNEMLATMFTPYQIEKVMFSEEIVLRSLGNISDLSLQVEEKESYKVFQANEQSRKFLLPVKNEGITTIEEAFVDMKKGEKTLNVFPTIPEDFDFTLTTSDNQLFITSEYNEVFEDEQRATIMIEAVLMTAKSFGYEFVTFKHVSVDQIGPYQLSETIRVPEAINPIYQ